MKNRPIALGLLLLGVSAYPLALMAREIATDRSVRSHYTIEPVFSGLEARLEGHLVRLVDDAPPSTDPNERLDGVVEIVVNSRTLSSGAKVRIRPYFEDANRYHGYVSLMKLVDRESGLVRIVVSQSIGPATVADPPYRSLQRYRVLSVSSTGEIEEDVFNYDERGSPAVRTRLIA